MRITRPLTPLHATRTPLSALATVKDILLGNREDRRAARVYLPTLSHRVSRG